MAAAVVWLAVAVVALVSIVTESDDDPPAPLVPSPPAPPNAPAPPPVSPPPSSPEEETSILDGAFGIALGIFLGASASIGINIGNNMQALGLKMGGYNAGGDNAGGEGGDGKEGKPGDKIFTVGTVIFVTSSIINFVAFGFAPASVLAPLESIQFVANLLFNHYVNGAHISRRMINGVVLVMVGCSTAVGLGPTSVFKFTIQDLVDYWTSTAWILYLWLVIMLTIGAECTYFYYNEQIRKTGRAPPYAKTVLPVSFAMSSALIGTQSVVQAKALSECLEQLFKGVIVFKHLYFWMALFLFVSLVAVWLFRLTKALEFFDPLFIIPLLQSNYILFATISGGIYFKEFDSLKGYQWFGFVSGIGIMFSGLYLLAPIGDEEETIPSAVADACREITPGSLAATGPLSANSAKGGRANFSSTRAKTVPTVTASTHPPPPNTPGDLVVLPDDIVAHDAGLDAGSIHMQFDGQPGQAGAGGGGGSGGGSFLSASAQVIAALA